MFTWIGWLLTAGVFSAAGPAGPPGGTQTHNEYVDETIHVDLPVAWTMDGSAGEYLLETEGDDLASLLVLAPESGRTLEERLADIEEQFLSTGHIRLDASVSRTENGEDIHYRRYRLFFAGSEEEDTPESEIVLLHQYSFRRADVQVLLQVETGPSRFAPDDLAFRVFQTLEIRRAPDPFHWEEHAAPADSTRPLESHEAR